MNGKEFINLLKRLDIDPGVIKSESVDWLFCKSETNEVLSWLCRYVSENNVETDQELYLSKKIQDDLLSGYMFEKKFDEIDQKYPGIFDINPEDISHLEREYTTEEKSQKTLEKLTTNYLTLDYKTQQQLTRLERKELQLQAENEMLKKSCSLRSKELESEHNEVQKNVIIYSNILHSFYKSGAEKYFLSQMHLNSFKQQDDLFNTYLNLWIEKEFIVDSMFSTQAESFSEELLDILDIGKEYQRIYECIRRSYIDRIVEECMHIELTSCLEYLEKNFDNNLDCQSNDQEINMKKIQKKRDINVLTEQFTLLRTTELPQVVEKYVQNMINCNLSKQAKIKYSNYCKTLNKMKMLNNFLLEVFCINFLLVHLLKNEKRILHTAIKSLSTTQLYLINQREELENISYLINRHEQEFVKYTQTPLVEREEIISDFLKIVSDFKTVDIQEAWKIVQHQDAIINSLKPDICSSENKDSVNSFTKIENKIKELKKKIWSGPTLQPVIVPYTFIENMYSLEAYLQKMKDKLTEVCQKYKETQVIFSDRWTKDKKLLPVWFLTEPKKLITAIKRIEDHIVGKPVVVENTLKIPEAVLLQL